MTQSKEANSRVIGLAGALELMGINLRDPTPPMTGQLVAMLQNETDDGRELVCLFGVVAVPKDTFSNLHQYTIAGWPRADGIECVVDTSTTIDREEQLRGVGISGIITSGIWRY